MKLLCPGLPYEIHACHHQSLVVVNCRAGGVTNFYGHGQIDALAAIRAGPQVPPLWLMNEALQTLQLAVLRLPLGS